MAESPPNPCPRPVVLFSVGTGLLVAAGFVALMAATPSLRVEAGTSPPPGPVTRVLVLTVAGMFTAGALGGCLYNFRGLVKHATASDFDPAQSLSYYLRPVSGGISGLVVFFLLLGGAITLNVDGGAAYAWATLLGRMPYIAFALLAGYGSHEFMLKLKDLADAFFALRGGNAG